MAIIQALKQTNQHRFLPLFILNYLLGFRASTKIIFKSTLIPARIPKHSKDFLKRISTMHNGNFSYMLAIQILYRLNLAP